MRCAKTQRVQPVEESRLGLSTDAVAAAVKLLEEAAQDADCLADLEGCGPVSEFEGAFANWAGAPNALAVANGTSALVVALRACGVIAGDEVVVSAYGWGQTVGAVLLAGATPVFADIDPRTLVMDPASAKRVLSKKTRAILVTHLFGQPADMVAFEDLAGNRGIPLIADAAQADGARLHGRPLGSFGDASAYSLGRGKLVTAGEGGVFVCRDRRIYENALLVSQHPIRARLELLEPDLRTRIDGLGWTSRLSALAACIALSELRQAETRRATRRNACLKLAQALDGLPGIHPPVEADGAEHGFHIFALTYMAAELGRISRRQTLDALREHGLPVVAGPVSTPLPIRFHHSTGQRPKGEWRETSKRCERSELVFVSRSRFLSMPTNAAELHRGNFEAALASSRRLRGAPRER